MTTIQNTVAEIKGAWGLLFGSIPTPPDNQLGIWILRYGGDAVKDSVARAGRKFERLNGEMDGEYLGKYISAILRR